MPERQVITSLAGTVAPLLTVETSNPESTERHSIWQPRMWKKSTPFVIDDNTLTPNNPTGRTLGVEMTYDLPKMAHLVRSMVLHFILPPHTIGLAAGGLPAQAYVVDHLGFAITEYFRTHFGANLCYETLPHDLYFKYRKIYGIEQRDATNYLVGGDQTIAQRTNDLVNGREYFIKLFQPFEEHQSKAFPLLTLSQKTRFAHKPQILNNLVYNPSNVTITPNADYQFELIMKMVHLTGDEAALILNFSKDQQGISYMIHQHIRQNADDIANTASFFQQNVRMTAFTKPMKKIFWGLIPTNLISNMGYNDIFFFTPQPTPVPPGMNPYSPIQSYNITASGQIIQRTILRDYDRVYNHMTYFDSPHGDEIFNQIYNEYPNSFNAGIGYLDWTNFNNPFIQITFGVGGTGVDPLVPGAAQKLRLLFNGEDYNFWYFQNGNFTRTFN